MSVEFQHFTTGQTVSESLVIIVCVVTDCGLVPDIDSESIIVDQQTLIRSF